MGWDALGWQHESWERALMRPIVFALLLAALLVPSLLLGQAKPTAKTKIQQAQNKLKDIKQDKKDLQEEDCCRARGEVRGPGRP